MHVIHILLFNFSSLSHTSCPTDQRDIPPRVTPQSSSGGVAKVAYQGLETLFYVAIVVAIIGVVLYLVRAKVHERDMKRF